MNPIFDADFSRHSYGFRPERRAHDAVKQAQHYIQEGFHWVVDMDLAKFFDRVIHDMLMARVARKVTDKCVLKLIRAYLNAGVMANGVFEKTGEGTPQCGPLSPLLANILLDDLDKELTERGLRFVRYADDCNIFVASKRAGKRVMDSEIRFVEGKLKMKVNREKSAVDRPWNRKVPGIQFPKRQESDDSISASNDLMVQGEGARANEQNAFDVYGKQDYAIKPLSHRLDWLFPVSLSKRSLREIRPVDSPQATHVLMKAMETGTHPNSRAPRTRRARMGMFCHG